MRILDYKRRLSAAEGMTIMEALWTDGITTTLRMANGRIVTVGASYYEAWLQWRDANPGKRDDAGEILFVLAKLVVTPRS